MDARPSTCMGRAGCDCSQLFGESSLISRPYSNELNILQKEVMGRWVWRGYLQTGGHLLGRWRDTFTPEHLRGEQIWRAMMGH